MIGRLLCLIGRHQWWPRSTWPYSSIGRPSLDGVTAVCGRCPKKRYA